MLAKCFLAAALGPVVCGAALLAVASEPGDPAAAPHEPWTKLFDGQTLDGWSGDADLWSVEHGTIVGSTDGKTIRRNSFLIFQKPYKNFVLRLKFKLRNGNSGVQVRSKASQGYVASGYQADIADKRYMGILYEERGRGILADVDPEKVQPHIKPGDWNQYVITADGNKLKFELNGYPTIEYTETDAEKGAAEGLIALQLHTGPKMRVEFKDIEIQELP